MSRRGGSQANGRLHLNDDESRFPYSFLEFPRSRERRTGFPSMGNSTTPTKRRACASNALLERPLQASESRPEDERWLSHYGLRREARPVHMARNQISQTGLLSTRGGPNVRPDEVNHSFRWRQLVSRTKKILRAAAARARAAPCRAALTRQRVGCLTRQWAADGTSRVNWRSAAEDRDGICGGDWERPPARRIARSGAAALALLLAAVGPRSVHAGLLERPAEDR